MEAMFVGFTNLASHMAFLSSVLGGLWPRFGLSVALEGFEQSCKTGR